MGTCSPNNTVAYKQAAKASAARAKEIERQLRKQRKR
jgi:hypothetical protein